MAEAESLKDPESCKKTCHFSILGDVICVIHRGFINIIFLKISNSFYSTYISGGPFFHMIFLNKGETGVDCVDYQA